MWAEAFHAFADSGNEVLLLVAQRQSEEAPDERHPLGHGRAAYFWALVALGVFVSGALLSVHQGIEGLLHRDRAVSFRIAYLILFISFCLDGASLIQAQRQLRREARALDRTFLEHLDLSSDPVVRAVFAEDAAAVGHRQSAKRRERRSPRARRRSSVSARVTVHRASRPRAARALTQVNRCRPRTDRFYSRLVQLQDAGHKAT